MTSRWRRGLHLHPAGWPADLRGLHAGLAVQVVGAARGVVLHDAGGYPPLRPRRGSEETQDSEATDTTPHPPVSFCPQHKLSPSRSMWLFIHFPGFSHPFSCSTRDAMLKKLKSSTPLLYKPSLDDYPQRSMRDGAKTPDRIQLTLLKLRTRGSDFRYSWRPISHILGVCCVRPLARTWGLAPATRRVIVLRLFAADRKSFLPRFMGSSQVGKSCSVLAWRVSL